MTLTTGNSRSTLPTLDRLSPGGPSLFGIQQQTEALQPYIEERIARVIEHGRFILGPEVEELEERLAEWTGGHVVTVSSGRDALLMALLDAGIGEGDAVAVPAFTFPATAEVVTACGAHPAFIDVDPDTWTMDPDHLAETARTNPWLKAVIPVDIFGLPANYPAILPICAEHKLHIICDAAQSFGASLDWPVVDYADAALSFYPTKPLGCFGDGGALVTFDAERAERYRLMRGNGITARGEMESDIGMTARLDTIQAAVLLAKLDVFEYEIARRQMFGAMYDAHFEPRKGVTQKIPKGYKSARALYTVRLKDRANAMQRLADAGIPSKIYYPVPLYRQPAFAKFTLPGYSLPVTERLCSEVLSIPFHPYMTTEELEKICATI